MLFPNVFIGKIWRKSQKGVYLQRQKISKRCVVWQFKNLKKVCNISEVAVIFILLHDFLDICQKLCIFVDEMLFA